jgi:branched-chain amino acid transport system substrate-binding protein
VRLTRALFAFLIILPVVAVAATPGVTSTEITIGSCTALSGPSQSLGQEMVRGANLAFKAANDAGGIHGRKVRLITEDDGYDPTQADGCFRRLIGRGVFATGFFVGTPTTLKYVDLAETNKVPLVGAFTGAPGIYTPLRSMVFTVRASYPDEIKESIDNLWKSLAVRRVALIVPDDAFGTAVSQGTVAALKAHNATPSATATYPRQTTDVAGAVAQAKSSGAEAVVFAAPYKSAAAIVRAAHASGWRPLFVTVSFVGADDFIQEGKEDAERVIITQVVPPYYLTDYKGVSAYRRAIFKYDADRKPGFVSLEGFVNAQVILDALTKAGPELTHEKFIAALQSMHSSDRGFGPKLVLSYSAEDHRGFETVFPTIVIGGRAVPITDWSIAAQH